jgi:hypothetical protein
MKKLLIPTSFKEKHKIAVIVMTGMFETATYLFSHRNSGTVRIKKKSHGSVPVIRTQYRSSEHITGH